MFVGLLKCPKSRLESELHPRVPWPRYCKNYPMIPVYMYWAKSILHGEQGLATQDCCMVWLMQTICYHQLQHCQSKSWVTCMWPLTSSLTAVFCSRKWGLAANQGSACHQTLKQVVRVVLSSCMETVHSPQSRFYTHPYIGVYCVSGSQLSHYAPKQFRLIQVLCNLIFEIKAARLMNLAPSPSYCYYKCYTNNATLCSRLLCELPLCPSVTSQLEGHCNLKK